MHQNLFFSEKLNTGIFLFGLMCKLICTSFDHKRRQAFLVAWLALVCSSVNIAVNHMNMQRSCLGGVPYATHVT